MANQITAAAPPTTTTFASQFLATMASLSGVVTDYNRGSQVRTQALSIGAVVEQQSVWTQAAVFQGVVYSAMSLFGITPEVAAAASGIVNFVTAADPASGAAANQNVAIPQGTIVATPGGIQYATTAAALLPQGSSGISVPAAAVVGGLAGNVGASGVTQIVSSLAYPLFLVNPNPMAGGLDAETPTQTLARFTAKIASVGLSSPGAIANAAIGVTASGTGETCLYSTVYEPWIAAGSGSGSGVAGWSLYIDNGLGTASSGLIGAVGTFLNGGMVSGATNAGAAQGVGFRDAGVPYQILPVVPTFAVVAVSGVVNSLSTVPLTQVAMQTAISGYFILPFGGVAQRSQIEAAVANSAAGVLSSLNVSLMVSGSGTNVSGIGVPPFGRVILGAINLNITQGS